MNSMKRAILAFMTFALIVLPLAAGGGSQAGGGTASSASTGTGRVSYPIKTDVTLTYWLEPNQNNTDKWTNFGDTPFSKLREQKTGIKVQFLQPAIGQGREQFNLVLASGDLPDIFEYNWLTSYTGGPEKAIEDGIIHKLNDIFERWGPNVSAYLKSHPEFDRQVKTDNSSYYVFPYLRGDFGLLVTNGPQMRKDWLDELGFAVPETLDEWHTILTAFRDRKGARAPFSWTSWDRLPFFYAYGEWPRGFRLDDSRQRIVFSPIQDGYRSALTVMNQWYREGLLDQDFASINTASLNQKMVSGTTGATAAQFGQGMGTWTTTARPTNPKFELIATPYPVLRKGDKVKMIFTTFSYSGSASGAITSKAKSVEVAARFLDWGYGEEGHNIMNFGTEGVSYNWVNGYPKFTDLIFKHPQGWSTGQSLAAYALSQGSGPMIQDMRYLEQYYELPEQAAAIKNIPFPAMFDYMIPPVTPTPDESREYARIMGEINTYVQEMEVKFILGTENLANWDTFVSTIRRMGIDRAVEIQTAALARYNRR